MTKQYVKVPTRGITAEELMVLWREGKLYREVETVSGEDLLARCQREALEYVQPIDEFATDEWRPYIREVWEAVVGDVAFQDMLVMQKGQMQGHLNRYTITNIVAHMMTLKIYQCDNLLVLHKKLEGTSKKNGIYKGAGAYCLSRSQRQKIKELIQNMVV